MSHATWLYISDSLVAPMDVESEVHAIVALSRTKNADLGVTGALLFSGTRFAQYLEGPILSIEALRQCISRDQRHQTVRTIGTQSVERRQFAQWSLAFARHSTFIERVLDQALDYNEKGSQDGARSLTRLLREFV